MRINGKSQWHGDQISHFLAESRYPLRLSFFDGRGQPRICSLWYSFADGALWCASHRKAFVSRQLRNGAPVAFEVSTNDYPYKGVRGTGEVTLVPADAGQVLQTLIDKYLGNGNQSLAQWLMSRAADEVAIRIAPAVVNAWDFSHRMSGDGESA